MAKYDKKSQEKVEETMHEMKEGKLRSGSGKKVTSRKQAIAIGLSEARKEGSKAPDKKSSSARKKTGSKTGAKRRKSTGTSKKTSSKSGSAKE